MCRRNAFFDLTGAFHTVVEKYDHNVTTQLKTDGIWSRIPIPVLELKCHFVEIIRNHKSASSRPKASTVDRNFGGIWVKKVCINANMYNQLLFILS